MVPAVNPVSDVEFEVVLFEIHVLEDVVLYCIVYPVAPLTAVQFNVAPDCEMLELINPVGAEHPVEEVAAVVNDEIAE